MGINSRKTENDIARQESRDENDRQMATPNIGPLAAHFVLFNIREEKFERRCEKNR